MPGMAMAEGSEKVVDALPISARVRSKSGKFAAMIVPPMINGQR
jgi:hypothetical protein